MSNAPANEFGSTHRPLSVLVLALRLWRILCAYIAAAAELRERALQWAASHSAMADSSFNRLHRDVMKIEARRLL